jgi:Carboxypeptidase regulatory-like domain/Tetratricopeptide repeat
VRAFARFTSVSALIPLMFMTASVSAQRGGPVGLRHEIVGKITNDADYSPMQNVAVRLTTQAGQMVSTTYTTPTGDYNFANLQGGDYVLTIQVEGFETIQQDARLTLVSVLTANIALHKTMAPKADITTTGDSISSRELNLPAKAQDALAKGRERLYQRHDAAGSLAFFRRVLEISPGFYEGYYLEGVAYTQQSQISEAEAAFHKAIDGSGRHYAEPYFALASLLTDEKQFSNAEQMAREGLASDPEAWRGHYELARALIGEGRPAEAEKSGLEARKRKADFAALYLILANIHMQLHNNEAVLDDVNAFLKLEPEGPASAQARAIKTQMEHALGRGPNAPER